MTAPKNDDTKPLGPAEFADGNSLVGELVEAAVNTRFLTRDEQPVSLGLIRAYTTMPGIRLTDRQWDQIRQDARLQSLLDWFREQSRIVMFPRLAAASTGGVEYRIATGFEIRVTPPSGNNTTSIVAISRLENAADVVPTLMFLRRKDGVESKIEIPEFTDGRAVFQMERESRALSDLLDPEVEVDFV